MSPPWWRRTSSARTLAAWYETILLIGSFPASDVLLGFMCGAAYLLFAVAVTAAASLALAVLGTMGLRDRRPADPPDPRFLLRPG